MVESYLRQSPLAHLGLAARAEADAATAGVVLCERPFLGHVDLRGDAAKARFRDAARKALGVALPVESNTAAASKTVTVLWRGPDQWLVVTAEGGGAAMAEALDAAPATTVDVSDAWAVIGLSGPKARDVLMKGCSVDLHPREFGPGRCVGTRLALATVVIHQTTKQPAYHIHVARSYAAYLWAWLEDAAGEYGLAVTAG